MLGATEMPVNPEYKGEAGCVADTVLMPANPAVNVSPVPVPKLMFPDTSQSPAVSGTLATLAATPLLRDMPAGEADWYSPQLPAFALSFVAVPTIPAVDDGVMAPVACSVVNLPAAGAVVPIAGGEAR